jgi:hypothetical protein
MELTGKLIAALPKRSGVSQRTGNSWASLEYVMEIPGQYPRHFVFTVFGEDRLKQFNLRKDEEVTVQFDIDAHEYNGRWFNEIRAYNVIRAGQQQATQQQAASEPAPAAQTAAPQQAPAPQQQQIFDNAGQAGDGSADDLPFS